MEYPWYEIINQHDELQQGDFVFDCPVLIPPEYLDVGDMPEVEVKTIDAVILTQSCDLVSKKNDHVMVGRFYYLNEFLTSLSDDRTKTSKARNKTLDNLRTGHFPAYHLLNKQESVFDDYLVVDFKKVFSIHRHTTEKYVYRNQQRIRLLPPYREHLSQAFARYFMRVGLPQDIEIKGY
ncbi:MAG: hypothetical protein U5L09_08870 [Bacteroidales bacterium]|nr:hypothetical protein [Bacteroidales bacterium]